MQRQVGERLDAGGEGEECVICPFLSRVDGVL